RKDQDDRAWPAGNGGMEGAADELGDAVSTVDLGDPLADRPEHATIVDLLEAFPLDHMGPDLADEEDHRGGILERGMQANRRVARAGPSRDKADPGPPRQLAIGFRHIGGAALLPADDELDRTVAVKHRVENREIRL